MRTQIERTFDPATVNPMKRSSAHDLSVAGAQLVSQVIGAGVVDEMHRIVTPVTVGGGSSAHPAHLKSHLELMSVVRFESGVVHLHYRVDVEESFTSPSS